MSGYSSKRNRRRKLKRLGRPKEEAVTDTPKFTKVEAGHYATADGRWAVVADGYEKSNSVGAEEGTGYEGFVGGEWALVFDPQGNLREDSSSPSGDNLDWYSTKREAVEAYSMWSKMKS